MKKRARLCSAFFGDRFTSMLWEFFSLTRSIYRPVLLDIRFEYNLTIWVLWFPSLLQPITLTTAPSSIRPPTIGLATFSLSLRSLGKWLPLSVQLWGICVLENIKILGFELFMSWLLGCCFGWLRYVLFTNRKEEAERRIGQSYCVGGRGMNLRFISSFGSFGRRLLSPSLERLTSFLGFWY